MNLIAPASLGLLLGLAINAHAFPDNACEAIAIYETQMEITAQNVANVNTTRTPEGGPYKIQQLVCDASSCGVVRHRKIKIVYDPDHVDADEDGYVTAPDIDLM